MRPPTLRACLALALLVCAASAAAGAAPQDVMAYLAQHVGPQVLGPHGAATAASGYERRRPMRTL